MESLNLLSWQRCPRFYQNLFIKININF